MEFLSRSKQPPSKACKEFKPESEAELQQLEIIFPQITTLTGQRILFCFTGHPKNSWRDVFDNFWQEFCDQFNNMVISGDFNLPDILWDSIDIASGVNELAFIETLHDHLLTQINKKNTVVAFPQIGKMCLPVSHKV